MPFNIGPGELIIVLIIALVVVGPGKLPEVGSSLGKSIREFRKAATDVKESTSLDAAPATASPAIASTVAQAATTPPAPVIPATAAGAASAPAVVAAPAGAPVAVAEPAVVEAQVAPTPADESSTAGA